MASHPHLLPLLPFHLHLHRLPRHRRPFQPGDHVAQRRPEPDMHGDPVPGGGVVRLPARGVREGDDQATAVGRAVVSHEPCVDHGDAPLSD